VKPGGKLSYQYHKKRSEHWTVIDGIATIKIEDKAQKLTSGESIFIAQGQKHSLANNSKNHLEIIEVQSGKYFGEDDIIRINDIYGRINK
jgi:mannose-6-phosphate isomerase